MSFNGSGTWIAPAGQPVVTGTVISSATFNTLVTDIQNTFNLCLTRDGQGVATQAFKIVDGTVTVPGLAFNAESATGFYRPAPSQIALSVAGTQQLLATTSGLTVPNALISGQHSITTSSSTSSLTITDTGSSGANLKLVGNGGTTPNKYLRAQAGNLEFVNSTYGAVIATLSDAGTLTANTFSGPHTGHSSLDLALTGGTMSGDINMAGSQVLGVANIGGNSNAGAFSIWGGLSVLNGGYLQVYGGSHATTPNVVTIGTASAERVRVDASGNVGIGGTSSITGLQLGNGSQTGERYIRNVTSTNDLYFGQSGGTIFGQTTGNIGVLLQNSAKPFGIGTMTAQPIMFGTNAVETMRLDSSGNLGIGSGVPNARLSVGLVTDTSNTATVNAKSTGSASVGANISGAAAIEVYGNFTGSNDVYGMPTGTVGIASFNTAPLLFGVNGGEKMRLDSSGNLDLTFGGYLVVRNNIVGSATSSAYSIGANPQASVTTGGYISVYGSTSGGAGQVILGNNGVSRVTVSGTGGVDIGAGSGKLTMAGGITRFESAEQTMPTGNALLTVAHGGPRKPDIVRVVWRCKITEGGWAVGDELNVVDQTTDGARAAQTVANATVAGIVFVSSGVAASRSTSAGGYALFGHTAANWRWVVYCIWL